MQSSRWEITPPRASERASALSPPPAALRNLAGAATPRAGRARAHLPPRARRAGEAPTARPARPRPSDTRAGARLPGRARVRPGTGPRRARPACRGPSGSGAAQAQHPGGPGPATSKAFALRRKRRKQSGGGESAPAERKEVPPGSLARGRRRLLPGACARGGSARGSRGSGAECGAGLGGWRVEARSRAAFGGVGCAPRLLQAAWGQRPGLQTESSWLLSK